MKAVIIHQWGANPTDNWYPWLKNELEKRGWEVTIPPMPDTDHPRIESWVNALAEVIDTETTLLIGHSLGSQTILRHLAQTPGHKVDAIFVAGWFTIKGIQPESEPIAEPWVRTSLDFEAANKRLNRVLAVFSTDDRFVDLENVDIFADNLHMRPLVLDKRGHFEAGEGVTTIPELLPWIDDQVT